MSCVTCGTSLPEGATVCTVCEPWAIPATAEASGLSAPSDSALPISSDVPRWMLRLARRHRPANVGYQQLERAWRISKVNAGIRFVAYGSTALADFFGFVVKVPALAVICFLLAMVGYIAGFCFVMTVRRNLWLGRAVALAGAQPALGYAGLARIPGIAKLTTSLRVIRVLSIVVFAVCVFVTDDRALPLTARAGCWSVYFVCSIVLNGWILWLLADAHKELARRLVVRR